MILKKWVEQVFPELAESEDERVRKAMIGFFKHEREEGITVLHYGVNIERMIAWLENQGEQKPTWSEEDENRINRLIAYFEDKESFTAEDDVVYADWLKALKERYTWKPSNR